MYRFLLVIPTKPSTFDKEPMENQSMRRIYIASIFILLIFSCTKDQKLTFENRIINANECVDCPQVKIEIPEAKPTNHITEKINTTIAKKVIEIIDFSAEKELKTITAAIQSFSSSYKELIQEFPESIEWEASIDGVLLPKYKDIRCVQLNSYMFTGGAHGYGATNFINFNSKTGDEFKLTELIKDVDEFTLLAEKMFRKQENIPLDKNINSIGFLFENDVFYLPENIGFTKNKIILVYNQYEIVSYADGKKIIEIPLSKIKDLLNFF